MSAVKLRSDSSAVTHEGYLSKVGQRLKQMHRRWFAIRDNFLFSFRNRDDPQPSSVTFLEGCFVESKVR